MIFPTITAKLSPSQGTYLLTLCILSKKCKYAILSIPFAFMTFHEIRMIFPDVLYFSPTYAMIKEQNYIYDVSYFLILTV